MRKRIALADDAFREELMRAAADHGTVVHISSGAVGSFDLLLALLRSLASPIRYFWRQ